MMKKKIVVVDDDPDLIYVVKMGLKEIGADYEILGVQSGEQCLELLKNNQIPDLILLDIMMPGMNGWDTAAEIKKKPSWERIPLIFLTAKTDSFSKTFGGIVGNNYITKPFEIMELKEKIDKILWE